MIYINYNTWFTDWTYRKKLCDQLSLQFTDFGINNIPNFGRGSSFQGLSMNGQAQKMNVNERYLELSNNRGFLQSLWQYKQLVHMSDVLFKTKHLRNLLNE